MSHMEKGELKIGLIIGKRSNCSTRTHTPRPRESGSASSFVHIYAGDKIGFAARLGRIVLKV